MSYFEKLQAGTPTLSYEVFPPKNPLGWESLYATLAEIRRRTPDFVSVTYGAGGSTRDKTIDLVSRIQRELGLASVAHLTCVGHSRDEIDAILDQLTRAGIEGIMALRGDPPKGDAAFLPHPEGFAHASELIAYIKARYKFRIGCACYPEKHPEAVALRDDIVHLKLKQDQGASVAVSQLFFDNENFKRFIDQVRAAGVTLPIIAGIMPVTGLSQLRRFRELSGTEIPKKLTDFLGEGDDETIAERGIDFGVEQCADLLDSGVAGLHLYTLNRCTSTTRITDALRARGYLPR
ncbi:MAG: methylenetetrahydrofolate reductase [NAD(P)H] [Capsulimonadaceae bacterium]|nr:methylenetetrahydrofolate reductase [NAD(P)H] [Capsulimonadaceae bacterium]